MTREELAQRVGVDQSYVWRLEERAERRPSPQTALALADALGVPDEELNDWLLAAGHEPLPFVGSVRKTVREAGTARRRAGKRATPAYGETGARAQRLNQLGLTNDLIDRLLTGLSKASLPRQSDIARAVSCSLRAILNRLDCQIETAIIPVAGGQHRLFAAHVLQRLVIGVIREAAEVGIGQIVLVVAPGYSDVLFEPIQRALNISIVPPMRLNFVEQPKPTGLGEAILRAQRFVGRNPFGVLLPDDIIEPKQREATHLSRLVNLHSRRPRASVIGITPVTKSNMLKCGVCQGERASPPEPFEHHEILKLVEKPDRNHPICEHPNAFGIVGRYVLQPGIFAALEGLKRRGSQSLELTDALESLRSEGESILGVEFAGSRANISDMVTRPSEITI